MSLRFLCLSFLISAPFSVHTMGNAVPKQRLFMPLMKRLIKGPDLDPSKYLQAGLIAEAGYWVTYGVVYCSCELTKAIIVGAGKMAIEDATGLRLPGTPTRADLDVLRCPDIEDKAKDQVIQHLVDTGTIIDCRGLENNPSAWVPTAALEYKQKTGRYPDFVIPKESSLYEEEGSFFSNFITVGAELLAGEIPFVKKGISAASDGAGTVVKKILEAHGF